MEITAMATIISSLWRTMLCARYRVKHFLYIISFNPPQEERLLCAQEQELAKHCAGHCAEYLTWIVSGYVHCIPTGPVQLSSLRYRCGNMVRRDYTDNSPGE